MEGENRIIEILSDLLIEVQGMKTDFNKRQDRTDEILAEHSLALKELRLSVMRLSEVIENFAAYDERLKKLEKVVFRQAS